MNRDKTTNPYAARRRITDSQDSVAYAHRRVFDDESAARLHARVDDHDKRITQHDAVLSGLVANMEGLTANTGRLADVLEAWSNVKGFWWTLKLMGAGVRILLPIIAFIGALVASIWLFGRTGQWDFRM